MLHERRVLRRAELNRDEGLVRSFDGTPCRCPTEITHVPSADILSGATARGRYLNHATNLPDLVRPAVVTRRAPLMQVPQTWMGSRDYAARCGAEWRVVTAASVLPRPSARFYGPLAADFQARLDMIQPELGVLRADDVYVIVPEGWVIAGGLTLPDHSWFGSSHANERQYGWPSGDLPVMDLAGTALCIASDWAAVNYGHFLLDVLPRIDLFERAGFTMNEIDHIICPHRAESYRHLLATVGVPLERCVWIDYAAIYHCERLVAPSFPGTRRNTPPWSVEFLRSRVAPRPSRRGRRLYVPRSTTRRILNEEELMAIVQKHGFEVFEPSSGAEDPRAVFAGAEVVVGGHGAALSDIAFCAPGAKVLDLIPSDMIMPGVYAEADSARLDYRYLIGASSGHRPPGAWGPSPYDCTVDADVFREAIADLCSEWEHS
jgi:hypothetical protein